MVAAIGQAGVASQRKLGSGGRRAGSQADGRRGSTVQRAQPERTEASWPGGTGGGVGGEQVGGVACRRGRRPRRNDERPGPWPRPRAARAACARAVLLAGRDQLPVRRACRWVRHPRWAAVMPPRAVTHRVRRGRASRQHLRPHAAAGARRAGRRARGRRERGAGDAGRAGVGERCTFGRRDRAVTSAEASLTPARAVCVGCAWRCLRGPASAVHARRTAPTPLPLDVVPFQRRACVLVPALARARRASIAEGVATPRAVRHAGGGGAVEARRRAFVAGVEADRAVHARARGGCVVAHQAAARSAARVAVARADVVGGVPAAARLVLRAALAGDVRRGATAASAPALPRGAVPPGPTGLSALGPRFGGVV